MPLIRQPHADPSLDPFDDGVGVLTRGGEVCGHVLTTRSWFWSPSSPFRRQWWIWYTIVWADGTREPETEDYPPFIAVAEMKAGFLNITGHDPVRSGRYDFEWQDTDDSTETGGPLDSSDDAVPPRESLIEAIAWWRVDPHHGRRRLSDAATDALLAGIESASVARLAGLFADDDPFLIDRVIDQVMDDLDLHPALEEDDELIVCRALCRHLLQGRLSARELAGWAHQRFHHDSASDDLVRLADIDDEFELAGTVITRSRRSLEHEVRLIASRIVRG